MTARKAIQRDQRLDHLCRAKRLYIVMVERTTPLPVSGSTVFDAGAYSTHTSAETERRRWEAKPGYVRAWVRVLELGD